MEGFTADAKRATKVVAIVGMAGSGKSEASRVFEKNSFARVRFGDITDEEVNRRGLELNEPNERRIRQELREAHGMAAYAKLSLTKIDRLLGSADVIVDGLYSWEEYTLLKGVYGDRFIVVAVWASPRTRHARLTKRPVRPLTQEQAVSRDISEIENLNKGGPIAVADFTIINESSLEALQRETGKVLASLV
jgi:dephospho-CoA kinase